MRTRVILGPSNDLHPGIHDSLVKDPPPGIDYVWSDAIHTFLLPRGVRLKAPLSPYRYNHWGEFLDFGSGEETVHSTWYPVLNRRAWVVDMGDIGSIFVGRFAWNPGWRMELHSRWSQSFKKHLKKRTETMLRALIHPSCRRILFRTQWGIRMAEDYLRRIGPQDLVDSFVRKCGVLYPTQRPLPRGTVEKKWKRGTFSVLFCGRDYEVKNGWIALKVFSDLAKAFKKVRFIYIGIIPESVLKKHRHLLHRIDYHPVLPRARTLNFFRRSHILFHPSKRENFGMVYSEAAAAGMAIVSATGGGMDFVREILGDSGALLVDRNRVPPDREENFFRQFLGLLLENPAKAADMGLQNYEMTTTGRLSLRRRDEVLSGIYREAVAHPAQRPLTLRSLPVWEESVPFFLSSEGVRREGLAYRREIGFEGSHLVF